MFTVSDENLDSEGRPGNKAVEEVVCTGYKYALLATGGQVSLGSI